MIELLAGPVGPILIFLLRVVDVSMGTVRFLMVTRGTHFWPSVLGFVEVLLWITAAGAAIQNLSSPLHVVGYAAGFGAGTWVGMWIEGKLALGTSTVQAFCRGGDRGIAPALRSLGLGVTQMEGEGLEGPVDVVSTVVRRSSVPRVIETIETQDPDAFITVYDTRARGGWFPGGGRK
ncbi:MAG: DUF5698 domain-containing protein [Longimicrobiales bacterium]|nr:DUF5698 domain-containing protein [Longimicrobiales bacterium]